MARVPTAWGFGPARVEWETDPLGPPTRSEGNRLLSGPPKCNLGVPLPAPVAFFRTMARSPGSPDRSTSPAGIAAEVERTIRSVARGPKRVAKYGAATFQGCGDAMTTGVGTRFVAVGFWNGAKLASCHPLPEESAPTSRGARLRTLSEARSKAFKDLVRAAVKLDATDPVHCKQGEFRRSNPGLGDCPCGPNPIVLERLATVPRSPDGGVSSTAPA